MARLLSPFSPSMALLLGCFALVLPPCSNGHASPKVDPNIRQKACDGQLVGPNSTVGNFGMQLGSDWAIITPQGDTSGLEGCFFRVDTSVGKTILTNCVVGHRCLAVGGVQGVRGAIGNIPGGPAVDVLTQVITAVDITTIEEQAMKSCRNNN
jgi:hypothetical protein